MPSARRIFSKLYYEKLLPCKYDGTWQQRFDWFQANPARDPEEMESLRRQLLGDLLRHAAGQVPYYRDVLRQIGAQPMSCSRFSVSPNCLCSPALT